MKTPDFSDAEVGDKVFLNFNGENVEGYVTDNRKGRIWVKFPTFPLWSPSFEYDGTRPGRIVTELFWQPLPAIPEECLRRPSHGK